MLLRNMLKLVVLPPMGQLLSILLALFLWNKRPRVARVLMALSLGSLWLLSTPRIADVLLYPLEHSFPALDSGTYQSSSAQAIVVLAGGIYSPAPEYSGQRVGSGTLLRMEYAAYLHGLKPLPVLVSGGKVYKGQPVEPIAHTMARGLEQQFSVPVHWKEAESRTTMENAQFSAKLLKEQGIQSIVLVSQAYHLRRAVPLFTSLGLEVTAAPTRFLTGSDEKPGLLQWLPSSRGLHKSTIAIHEWMGLLVYTLFVAGSDG